MTHITYADRIIIPVFLFLLCSSSASGYNLRQISKKDGLSNSAILSMCQDREGFMWFGSCDGLNMYDGLRIRTYKPASDNNTLSGNLIEDVIETADGIFWVQTNYGLNRFDKRTQAVEQYNVFSSNYRLRTSTWAEVFFIRENGFFVYYNSHSGLFRQVRLADVDYREVLDYMISDDGTLWVFCRGGNTRTYAVSKKDNHDIELSEVAYFDHPQGLVACFHEDGKVYFVDMRYTLYEYDLTEQKKYYVAELGRGIRERSDISSIIKHHDDFFIGFRTDGLVCLRYTPETAANYALEEIDVHSGIFCLLRDKRQDIVWIGTDGQGVFIYSNDSYSIKSVTFENFTHRLRKPVRAMLIDRKGDLWMGTKGDGIVKISAYDFNLPVQTDKVDYFNSGNSDLYDNSVYSISEGSHGLLWIGTEKGMNYYDYRDRRIKRFEIEAEGERVRYIHAVYEANDSVIWIATVGTGMVRASVEWSGDTPSVRSARRYKIRDGVMSSNYFLQYSRRTIRLSGSVTGGTVRSDSIPLQTSWLRSVSTGLVATRP